MVIRTHPNVGIHLHQYPALLYLWCTPFITTAVPLPYLQPPSAGAAVPAAVGPPLSAVGGVPRRAGPGRRQHRHGRRRPGLQTPPADGLRRPARTPRHQQPAAPHHYARWDRPQCPGDRPQCPGDRPQCPGVCPQCLRGRPQCHALCCVRPVAAGTTAHN